MAYDADGQKKEREKSYDESKVSEAVTEMDRRTLLRTASATAVGGAGLAATTGSAAGGSLTSGDCPKADASSDFERVSTRDHFDSDANLINGETEWSYDVEGNWDQWGDDLALFIHGWQSSDEDDEDIDHGYECQLSLEQEGWGGETAVYTWDSDKGGGTDQGWGEAKAIAKENGRKLANFTQWYANEHNANVRWIAHSLGAEVVLFACQSLDEDYGYENQVKSCSYIGGAVSEDDVSLDAGLWDKEWGDHLEFACEQFDNFHKTDDSVLDDIYQNWEWDEAVGESGCDGPEPSNYTDYDVTNIVSTHYDYATRDCGCITQVVDKW